MRGHIHKRTRKTRDGRSTTLWYVVLDIGRDANGRRQQKWHGSFRTRREAEAARAKLVNDLNTGTYVAPQRLTYGEWVRDSWLPMMQSRLKASTFDSYRRNMELHILPPLGPKLVQQITPTMLTGLYGGLMTAGRMRGGGLSAKTVRYLHTTIHKSLADAVDAGLLPTNPAERAKAPRPNRQPAREMGFWSPAELSRFLEHVNGTRLAALWRLAAMTGMRRGEVLGLRWSDVDLDKARVSIRHTLVSVAYELVESTPKSHQARVIDLDGTTIEELQAHRRRQQAERQPGDDDGDLVFTREDGSPIHPDSLSQQFEREVRRSGLPRIRLHDLRHTHATIALKAGVPVKVISERLGHESPAFTLKQYAHVIPGMQAEAANLVDLLVRESNGSRNPPP